MSKTVTVRRGEKLPENMVGMPFAVPVNSTIIVRPGDTYPENAHADSITVEVRDDPPQAYLIVPCEKGKGIHRIDDCGDVIYTATPEATHKQIPCALTLEDLQNMWYWGHVNGEHSDTFYKLSAIIAAWSAVPQAKESGK